MSKVKDDISRVRLEVDGKQAINQLGNLEMEAKGLQIDMKNAKKGTEEYVAANKKLREVEANIKKVRGELGLTGMTMTQLTRYQKDIQREINNTTTKGTLRYRELKKELEGVNRAITDQKTELRGTEQGFGRVNSQLKNTKGFFSDIKKELKTFAVLAVGALGITELFAGIQNMISGSARLSDAYADVQKTTGLTKVEVEELNKELKKIDTRTARSELLKLAADAGKIGVKGKKDLLEFAEGADVIGVALGEDLGDDAVKNIGKLNELFGIRTIFGYKDSMIKTGSAINELGAKSTASEGYLVDFAKRLGGAASNAKIAMTDILGLGATLDSLGQQSETSSTAVGTFLIDMFKDTKTYAEIAGIEFGEFTKLLDTDANEAFLKVLEGLNGNNAGLTTMVKKLEAAGVEGARGVQVISTLAGKTQLLREQQHIANTAFEKGTSILDEFNTKNQNFAGNLEKVQKWMAGLFVNSTVMDGLNTFIKLWADWIEIPISDKMEDERMALNRLHAQILTTNIGSADRIKLVNELKEMHPQILGDLNSETVSNDELSKAIKKVNEEMVNKIVIQKQQEEIDRNTERRAEKLMEVIEQETKLYDMQTKLVDKYGFAVQEAETPLEQFQKTLAMATEEEKKSFGARGRLFNQTANFSNAVAQLAIMQEKLNDLDGFSVKLLEEKEKLMKRLNLSAGETITPVTPVVPPVVPGITPDGSDEQIKRYTEKLDGFWTTYRDKVKESQQVNIVDTEEHLDNLIKLNEENGMSIVELEEVRNKMRLDAQRRYNIQALQDEQDIADAKVMIAQGLSTSIGAVIDFIGNRSGELTGFQKILAVSQIAIDSAIALGKIVPLAAAAASGSGPAAPFVFAGYIATMAGTVLSAIAKAKNVLSDSNVPQWNSEEDAPSGGPTSGTRRGGTAPRKSFYYGGPTGEGMGFGDRFGEYAGYVHKSEYVVPQIVTSDPWVANVLPMIESIRQDRIRGFATGGQTSAGTISQAPGMSNARLEALMEIMISKMDAMPTKMRAYLVYNDLEEMQEEADMLKSRFRA